MGGFDFDVVISSVEMICVTATLYCNEISLHNDGYKRNSLLGDLFKLSEVQPKLHTQFLQSWIRKKITRWSWIT